MWQRGRNTVAPGTKHGDEQGDGKKCNRMSTEHTGWMYRRRVEVEGLTITVAVHAYGGVIEVETLSPPERWNAVEGVSCCTHKTETDRTNGVTYYVTWKNHRNFKKKMYFRIFKGSEYRFDPVSPGVKKFRLAQGAYGQSYQKIPATCLLELKHDMVFQGGLNTTLKPKKSIKSH